MQEIIKADLQERISLKSQVLKSLVPKIEEAARWMIDSLRSGGKILIFGNGGSAADAQHLAAELVGRFKKDRPALCAIALTTDTSILTSLSNDYRFEAIFARQIEALTKKEDIALGISTSGNSRNVVEGIGRAKELGARTIALLGGDGGRVAEVVDLSVIVPSRNTPHIQECHITIGHILCHLIEQEFFR